jgi:hypothetical protein
MTHKGSRMNCAGTDSVRITDAHTGFFSPYRVTGCWSTVKETDRTLLVLTNAISEGFPTNRTCNRYDVPIRNTAEFPITNAAN